MYAPGATWSRTGPLSRLLRKGLGSGQHADLSSEGRMTPAALARTRLGPGADVARTCLGPGSQLRLLCLVGKRMST